MVIDPSAIAAILLNEQEAEIFEDKIAVDPVRKLSAAGLVEIAMVIEGRLGDLGGALLDLWLHKAGIDIVPVDAAQAQAARRAWRRYGKGRHPAGLNFGDCFSYALAKTSGEPLLFKGDDFALTDVTPA